MTREQKKKQLEGFRQTYIDAGRCNLCASCVFSEPDGSDPDPRGELGIKHAAATLVASEFGMQGADVVFCYDCLQTRETYDRAVVIAQRKWKAKNE
jgi:hypothetical protein